MTSPALPDVLVVGAGGSGAPLAARLADRGLSVVVLEAGPAPAPRETRDAARLAAAMPGHPLAFSYPGELTRGRPHTVTRGRVSGGSTAINGAYFRRPRAHDLDRWAAESGDERWSAANTAAIWPRIENDREFGGTAGHGSHGPMPVSRADLTHPVSAALVAAGLTAGLPLELDKNSSPDASPGVGATPTNTRDGERWSTARAYLDCEVDPEGAPARLDVRGGHQVVSVMLEHGRAVGVRALVSGRVESFRAGLVVLSAGAIATPHLLLMSGIGPAATLRDRGLDVVHDSPAVGARLGDHPNLDLRFTVPESVHRHRVEIPLGVALHASSGLGAEVAAGDIEVLSFVRPLLRMLGSDPHDEHLSLLVSTLRHDARGHLALDPLDISAPPHVRFHYAETEADRALLRTAARFAGALLTSDAMRELGALPEQANLTVLDDRELDAWVLAHLSTALHTCGTTAMGSDPTTSVVDGRGAVHGVRGLHVADVGMLPSTPTGGPAASAVLIGEVIADALTT